MREIRRWCVNAVILAFLLGGSFGFHVRALQAKQQARAVWGNATYLPDVPLSAEEAQKLGEKESGFLFAVWGEISGETVSDPDMGRRTQTDVIVFYGSPEAALPTGAALSKGDTSGCLIGEQTAWELFGSIGVVGEEICIGGGTRTIRGVIGMPGSCVLVFGTGETAADGEEWERLRFDRVTACINQEADKEQFALQQGLNASLLRLDYLLDFDWLAELVPGKWSDFSGWKKNIKQKEQDFALLSETQMHSPELYYKGQCRRYRRSRLCGILCAAVAAGQMSACVSGLRRRKEPLSESESGMAERFSSGGGMRFASIWNHIGRFFTDEAYYLLNKRLNRIPKQPEEVVQPHNKQRQN